MDERILRRIEKYKKVGWRIEDDNDGIALFGVGYLYSPRGEAFSFDELYDSGGFPYWDIWRKEDIKTFRSFNKLYRLTIDFCRSCYTGKEIEMLFDNN